MNDTAIKIEGVAKRFGDIQALSAVSFEVPAHSIFGLLGPNGAGKTTLFSIIADFLRADSGQVEVLGHDTRRASLLLGRMSILPQDAQFQQNVPVLEQLTFFRMLDGQPRSVAREEVTRCLELVGLEDYARRSARALSHGMMKRLGIAQAFLGTPEVILLDEPTSGLDPANARHIRDLVRELQKQATVVISSHNLAEIEDLCDRVAILDKGKLVLASSVNELTRSGRELDLGLSRPLSAAEIDSLGVLPGVAAVTAREQLDYSVRVDLTDSALEWDQVVASLLHRLLEIDAVPRRLAEGRSLEDHFLRVTGDNDKEQEEA